jgi:MFS family permease
VAAVYLGYSVGPFLGGYLTQYLGWRTIFFVNVFLGAITILFVCSRLKGEWYETDETKFDLTGSIIYSITLLLIMYGFSHLSTMLGVWLILLGALGFLIFIKWETKSRSPVLNISLYLQYIKRLAPGNAGFILVSQPIVQAFFSPIAGKLSDRIEPRIVASTGMTLTGVGLFMLAFLDEKTTVMFITSSLVILGFGFAPFSSPTISAVMGSVESRFYGVASGTLGTMRAMGMVFSMGITLLIFSIYIGKVQITLEYYPVFLKCLKLAFAFFGALCFAGIFTSLAKGNVR